MGIPEFDLVESPAIESTTYRSSTPRALSADSLTLFGERAVEGKSVLLSSGKRSSKKAAR